MSGEAWNTRDPSAQPVSGQGGSYKPVVKSSAVQQESEGIEVLQTVGQPAGTNAVTNNAAGGKGPCGGRAGGVGKREGMAGRTGPNDPGGDTPRDKVRQLPQEPSARYTRRKRGESGSTMARRALTSSAVTCTSG